jgi:hypothetical protein
MDSSSSKTAYGLIYYYHNQVGATYSVVKKALCTWLVEAINSNTNSILTIGPRFLSSLQTLGLHTTTLILVKRCFKMHVVLMPDKRFWL